LGLFLAMFLGYFTIPIVILILFAIVYTIADLGMVVVIRQRQSQVSRRALAEQQAPDQNSK